MLVRSPETRASLCLLAGPTGPAYIAGVMSVASEPHVFGDVALPGDGAPILLGYDRPGHLLALEGVRASEETEIVIARSGAEALRLVEQRAFVAEFTGVAPDRMQHGGWKAAHHPDTVDAVVERRQRSLPSKEPR